MGHLCHIVWEGRHHLQAGVPAALIRSCETADVCIAPKSLSNLELKSMQFFHAGFCLSSMCLDSPILLCELRACSFQWLTSIPLYG